jgi:hypothetical protein
MENGDLVSICGNSCSHAASMKFRVFWDVALYSTLKLTDVSEVRTASIIRGYSSPWEQSGSINLNFLEFTFVNPVI